VWLDHPDFEIPRPGAVAIAGFSAGWVAVGLLVAAFVWLLRAGA
jgi:hypothetical protein